MDNCNRDLQAPYRPLVITIAVVVATWAIGGLILYPLQDRGTIGDMFGAVNALFSGLAFACLIYTVWLQRIELQLQRRELTLTRTELEGQKLQLAAQNETLRKQNFEDTFFQLLRMHNDILNAIDLVGGDKTTTHGRDCFAVFSRRYYKTLVRYRGAHPNEPELESIRGAYREFFAEHQGELGHYFRSLYNIVKFVKHSSVEDKRLYTNLIRAQLSNQELLLLFYNGLSEYGSEKFKPLIEEFGLLKSLPREALVNQKAEVSLYETSAF